MVHGFALRSVSKVAMRWRKSCMLATRRDKQPRAKILISISAILSQLPWMPCVMELHALQDAPGLSWLEGFIQGGSRMGIQVILHEAHVFRVRINPINQPLDAMGI